MWLPVSNFSVKIGAFGSLKRVTGRIFKIGTVSTLKEQAKILSLIFSSAKKKKVVKTISACTESTRVLIYY
jgi:hypothetical protein